MELLGLHVLANLIALTRLNLRALPIDRLLNHGNRAGLADEQRRKEGRENNGVVDGQDKQIRRQHLVG